MDELKAIRFCEAVARLGSFTRAAEEMAIAQPALSIAVSKLERRLGVTLFHRLPRGAEPTAEGRLLLARGAGIFDVALQLAGGGGSARRPVDDGLRGTVEPTQEIRRSAPGHRELDHPTARLPGCGDRFFDISNFWLV